ncbi:MAG TPA: hypothetical protein VGK68_09290 [Gaiellaceae bacterium]
MEFDWKRLSTLDRVIAGAAAIAFVSLFLPWYGVTVGPFGASVSGWSAGFSAWAGGLLLTAAGVLLVLRRSGASLQATRVGPSLLVGGIAALGLLLVIIRWLTFPSFHVSGVNYDVGARYGIYLALIVGIAEVSAAVMELRASGEQMPWSQAEHRPAHAEPAPEAPAATDE